MLPALPKPEGPPAPSPPPQVPALRLGFKPAESSFNVQQHQQQQGGGTPLGRPALALAIPRLNLPGTPPLGSPVEGASPTAPSSARLGRPPLPPLARTARLGTPRTSRLVQGVRPQLCLSRGMMATALQCKGVRQEHQPLHAAFL